jgi:hypothetical protein
MPSYFDVALHWIHTDARYCVINRRLAKERFSHCRSAPIYVHIKTGIGSAASESYYIVLTTHTQLNSMEIFIYRGPPLLCLDRNVF